MIRWSYVLPRLVLIAILALFVCFALDPLLRWAIVQSAQRATGARVDVDRLVSSLAETTVRLQNVQVADPSDTNRNLFQASQVTLQLDRDALLRRNWIVDRGEIRQISIDAARDDSGRLDDGQDGDSQFGGMLGKAGRAALDQLGDTLEQDVESLETVQVSRELMDRWPREYAQIDARVDHLQSQIKDLEQFIEAAKSNPLSALERHQQVLLQINALRRTPAELRQHIEQLRRQAGTDKVALQEASRRDKQRVHERLKLLTLDGETLSHYLLGPQWAKRVTTALDWIRTARGIITAGAPPEARRKRGIDILFPGLARQPDFLIRTLLVDGQVANGDQPLQFTGRVENITTEPVVHGKPTVAQLETMGHTAARIHAVLDETGPEPIYRVVFDCPELPQPAATLGRRDQLAIDIPSGKAHVWANIEIRNEDLTGRIVFKQDALQLAPHAAPDVGGEVTTRHLQRALGDLRHLHAAVDLSGSLQDPNWKLQTNLGPQLATGMNNALKLELDSRRTALLHEIDQIEARQLARFQQLVDTRRLAAIEKLNLTERQVDQVRRLIGGQLDNLTDRVPFGKVLSR